MIDLLKNYKELRNSSGYIGTLRYEIAKKKIDVVFFSLSIDIVREMAQQSSTESGRIV